MWLKNVRGHGVRTGKGACCIRCSRLFLERAKKSGSARPAESESTTKQKRHLPVGQAERADSNKEKIKFATQIDRIPQSTILVAKLWASCVEACGNVVIVADERDQSSEQGIYWVGRALPSMILSAIKTKPKKRFEYRGIEYSVKKYTPYGDVWRYLEIIGRFCDPKAPQTIYIFAQKNLDRFASKNYEMVTAMVPCADREFLVPITVYYDKEAHRYFMNEVTYTIAREKYGLPYLKLRSAQETGEGKGFDGLRAQSELHLIGYNVSISSGMTAQQRRKLLTTAIDSGVLTKTMVVNHLEWLVNTRTGIDNMENAIGEWKADLMYILNYDCNRQRRIWAEEFCSRFMG